MRPNTRRKTPISEAVEAIANFLEIAHRMEGCSAKECSVCVDTKAKLDALRMAKARLEKEEEISGIIRELVDSPNAKRNALWDRARKAVGR